MDLRKSAMDRLTNARPALLVVDMQNDFCADGGYVSRQGRDLSACRAIVPRIASLIASARECSVPVIWVKADYSTNAVSMAMRVKQAERGNAEVCCEPGTWGAEPFGVAPARGETVIVKHRYSGFAGTQLDAELQRRDIDTLLFCGVQTNICVESTVRDAHSKGYFIVAVGDCVASHMPEHHRATLDNIRFIFGDVLESTEIVSAWSRDYQPSLPAV
ncbi:MAG: cysteine hydrolase family protein [Steroidobacteraceae bacterium]